MKREKYREFTGSRWFEPHILIDDGEYGTEMSIEEVEALIKDLRAAVKKVKAITQ